jgi:hypothetical protein
MVDLSAGIIGQVGYAAFTFGKGNPTWLILLMKSHHKNGLQQAQA